MNQYHPSNHTTLIQKELDFLNQDDPILDDPPGEPILGPEGEQFMGTLEH